MDRIQGEMTENGRLLRPFKSSGQSLRTVEYFWNLINYVLWICWTFYICFRILALIVLDIWSSQKSVYWENIRKFCCLDRFHARWVRPIGSLVTTRGCVFICWIQWYFWIFSTMIIEDLYTNKVNLLNEMKWDSLASLVHNDLFVSLSRNTMGRVLLCRI